MNVVIRCPECDALVLRPHCSSEGVVCSLRCMHRQLMRLRIRCIAGLVGMSAPGVVAPEAAEEQP